MLATVGFQMLGVAVGWQLYELTGSALDLGLVGLAQFLPMVLLTLVVGQVADRCDRRLIVVVCEVVKAAAAAALALGALGGWQSRGSVFALVALLGAAQAFENPAMSALVPQVVARSLIAPAMAWVISAGQTAQIVGPALGGLLYAFGPGAAYFTAGGLFILAGALSAAIRVDRVPRSHEPLTLEAVFSGVAFIYGRRVLLGSMSLDLFAVLLGGATALLPIFAKDILPWGRSASACCARRPRWARWPCPCSWRATARASPRADAVPLGDRLRGRHRGLRPLDELHAVAGRAHDSGRGGRGEHRHPACRSPSSARRTRCAGG